MRSYISEFESKEKPKDYYAKIIEELKRKNAELNAFNIINDEINSGFPFSVKDNICVKGVESTASSKILKTYTPPFDATVVEKFKHNGFSFDSNSEM